MKVSDKNHPKKEFAILTPPKQLGAGRKPGRRAGRNVIQINLQHVQFRDSFLEAVPKNLLQIC
jgi:hypothetical protein